MNLRRIIAGWALGATAVLGTIGTASSAQASEYPTRHCYQPQYTYKTVTVWVNKKVPYLATVVRYKPCGTPYYDHVVRYKWIKAPVKKTYRAAL